MKLPLITIIDTELNRGTYMGKQPVGLDDFCLRITEEYKRYGADVYTIPRDYYSSWVARRGDSLPMGWVTFQDKNRYKNNTEEKWMYTVSSDNITNNQFSTGGDDHHSYTTVSRTRR
jgi:hypothetical protein